MVSNPCSGYGTKITEAHYEKLAADLNTNPTNPEQSKLLGPVAPHTYGEPNFF